MHSNPAGAHLERVNLERGIVRHNRHVLATGRHADVVDATSPRRLDGLWAPTNTPPVNKHDYNKRNTTRALFLPQRDTSSAATHSDGRVSDIAVPEHEHAVDAACDELLLAVNPLREAREATSKHLGHLTNRHIQSTHMRTCTAAR